MATAAGRNRGDLWIITMDGDTLGYSSSASLSLSVNIIDTSNKNSSRNEESIVGNKSGSLTFDAFQDFGASAAGYLGFNDIVDYWQNGTAIAWRFTTGETGDYYLYGNGYIESLDITADHDGATTYSGSIVVTGGVTKGTN